MVLVSHLAGLSMDSRDVVDVFTDIDVNALK